MSVLFANIEYPPWSTDELLSLTLEEQLARRHRYAGAVLIARMRALQEHPEVHPDLKRGAAYWECTLKARHGHPREGWLRRQIAIALNAIDGSDGWR